MSASRLIFITFLGLCSVAAFGQTPVPAPGTDQKEPAQPSTAPNRGARDSSQRTGNNPNQTEEQGANPNGAATADTAQPQRRTSDIPDIINDDPNTTPEEKASAEYSGPAVLSRGISASAPMNPKNLRFTPNLGLEYIYSSGLTGITIQNNGKPPDQTSSGLSLNYGLKGEKVYKSDIFSLNFSGNVYHYDQSSYDGSDNQLAMTWRHRLSRHLSFGIRESFQAYNRNNLLLSGSEVINTGVGTTQPTTTPLTEAFDGRVLSLFNEGDVIWQITSRLSIDLSGGGFFTRRASDALYGTTGYQGGADLAYRITRRVTAGLYYGYTHFDFTRIYGGADINMTGLTYSIAFNPTTELITRLGGARIENTGLTSVALDPFLGQLLGRPTTIQAFYRVGYAPDVNVQIRHKISNLELSLLYSRGVTPGNGVILTSTHQSAGFGVNYKTRRNWNFGSSGGYDSLHSVGPISDKYGSVFAQASIYRTLHKGLQWHARLDYHHYTFDNTGFLRNTTIVSTGIMWTPGDILERVW